MKKLVMIIVAGLLLLSVAAAIATAEVSENKWKPAGTQFKIQSKDSVFVANTIFGEVSVHCGQFHLVGTTPAGKGGEFSEAEAQAETEVKPSVEQCNQTTTVTGPWHIQLHSEKSKATCGAKEEDPNPEDDCFTIHIPNEGAKINFGICEVKVNANEIKGVYDDDFPIQQKAAGPFLGRAAFQEQEVKTGGSCNVPISHFTGSFLINPRIHDDDK